MQHLLLKENVCVLLLNGIHAWTVDESRGSSVPGHDFLHNSCPQDGHQVIHGVVLAGGATLATTGPPASRQAPAAHVVLPQDKTTEEMLIAALHVTPDKSERPALDTPGKEKRPAICTTVPSAPGTPPRETTRESRPAAAMQLESTAQISRASMPSSAAAPLDIPGGEQRRHGQPLSMLPGNAQCAEPARPGAKPAEQQGQAQRLHTPHAQAESAGGDVAWDTAQPAQADVPLGLASATKAADGSGCGTPVAAQPCAGQKGQCYNRECKYLLAFLTDALWQQCFIQSSSIS